MDEQKNQHESLNPQLPLLLVDDAELALKSYSAMLRQGGYNHLILCQDSRRVLPLLAEHGAEAVLLDLHMPHLSGEELLPQIVRDFPHVPVVIVTANDKVETAVRCIKSGAFDYVVKPVPRDRLLATIRQASCFRDLTRENRTLGARFLAKKLEEPEIFLEIVTNNEAMREIFQYVEAVARTKQPILITGETGVGKELLARAIHRASGRQGEFVAFNAAGLDDELFADTLFGHLKGAFTGAGRSRRGLVEEAAGGTLFMDEIGDLSLVSQVKLLRLLQESEYLPLGADTPKPMTARIVAATNRQLTDLQGSERFRKDLYYRLSAHHIHVPPLRERLDDLPLLLAHFGSLAAQTFNRVPPRFPETLPPLLAMYDFPGNIRELQAIIFDAVSRQQSSAIALEVFEHRILPGLSGRHRPALPVAGNGEPLVHFSPVCLPTLEQLKSCLIEEALVRTRGNKTLAAKLIGISRQALNWRRKKMEGGD